MKAIKLILAFAILANTAIAQKKSNEASWLLRFSPASLIDPYHPSITVGGEYFLSKQKAIGLDYSFLLPTISPDNEYNTGFILKPTFKYFFKAVKEDAVEVDVFWKKVSSPQTRWVGEDYVNGFPSYFKRNDYTLVKDVFGFNVKLTSRTLVANDVFFIEVYAGIGFRTYKAFVKEKPDEVVSFKTPFFRDQQKTTERYWTASFPLGIRIVVPIK